jgi:hypothetical protein
MVTPTESFMGVNLLADRPLRAIHHTDYLPLLESDVNIADLGFIRDKGPKVALEQIIVADRRH